MWSRLWSLDSWFSEPRVKTVKKLNPADYDQEKVEELNNLLFPNVSSIIQQTLVTKEDGNGSLESTLLNVNRNLASTPVCVLCSNLQYCKALNGLLIQEVYLPGNPDQLGTCRVYEDLGERIYNEIFGIGKTFRDSDQCKLIVMQYLCLMWGSDNLMYKSECHSCCEDVSDPNPNNRRVAPLYPCRSFCTQISQVCAYDKNYIQLCERIPCGESNDYCTPDPSLDNAVLATGLGCDFPVHANPYATGHAFRNTNPSAFNFICLFILIYIFTIMKQ
jgi:hypothetical protein